MKRSKQLVPAVRLSDKERMIVRYIVGRLESVYRDTNGKPVYARNMDQVVEDMWGIKHFCKTLRNARYNESIMISLMKSMDTNTLWMIVRSKEHFKILCYMVAMDHHIVHMGKKYNKLCDLDPVNRPTGKMRKLQKEIKKSKKTYKSCVGTMREIFDIEKVGSANKGNALREIMTDWLERNDTQYDDDIFFGLDGYGLSSIETMDQYVAQHTRQRYAQRPGPSPATGALGIFDNGLDDDDDDDFDVDTYGDVQDMLRSMGGGQAAPQYAPGYYPPPPQAVPMAPTATNDAAIVAILNTIQSGFERLNGTMSDFLDSITEPADDETGVPLFVSGGDDPSRPAPGAALSVDQVHDMVNGDGTGDNPPQN